MSACRSERRRIPYILPDLPNWSASYRAPKGLRLHAFRTTGSIEAPGWALGGSWAQPMTVEVPAFLIEHPERGRILVGTGLNPGAAESPHMYFGWLLGALVTVKAAESQDLVSQLEAQGFAADEIDLVILPDGRFPQTGQVPRFPRAEVVISRVERAWVWDGEIDFSVRSEDLHPVREWSVVDFETAEALGTFPHAHDLLGDGSVVLLDAPGYTPGSMAVMVRLASGPIVLGAGVIPGANSLRIPVIPGIATDRDAWWLSAWRLKRFRELASLDVIPGFEVAPLEGHDDDLILHEFSDADVEDDDSRGDEKEAGGS